MGGEEVVEREGSYHIQCKSDRAPTVSIVIDFMKETGALAKSAKFFLLFFLRFVFF